MITLMSEDNDGGIMEIVVIPHYLSLMYKYATVQLEQALINETK